MTNNSFAVTNIETMAHNVAVYASYYNRENDTFGEVDDAVMEAKRAVGRLAFIMRNYSSTL